MTPHRTNEPVVAPVTSDIPEYYALSAQQRQLVAQLGGWSATWRARLSLGETIDAERLTAAVTAVRNRHEILRTSFVSLPGYSEPLQRVHAADEPVGLTAHPVAGEPDAIDLEAPALAVDAHSWTIIARDLSAFYFGEPAHDVHSPVQYADYVAWQEDVSDARQAVRGAPPRRGEAKPAHVALRRPSATRPRLSAKLAESKLSSAASDAIRSLARELSVDEATVLLACWTLFIEVHANSALISHAVDGRGIAQADGAVGPYHEWRGISVPEREQTFTEYVRCCDRLARVARAITAAGFEESYAFEWIRLDSTARGIAPGDCPAAAALRLRVVAGGDISLALSGDVREWSPRASELLLARLCGGIRQLADEPGRFVSSIRWIGDGDLDLIHWIGISTLQSVDPDDFPHIRFASIARRHPHAPALIKPDGDVLSYAAVLERVSQLSEKMRARHLRPGDIVALELEGADLIVGILAVWSCGAAFVSLPGSVKQARRAGIVAVAQPRFRIQPGFEINGPANETEMAASGIACVAFTSGSTGTPRGVLQPYAAVAGYLAFVRELTRIGPGDVVLQLASPDFDASMRDSIGPLTAGAALVLAPAGKLFDAEATVRSIAAQRVTALLSVVPSVLRAIILAAEHAAVPGFALRTILCAGEPLLWEDVHRARRVFGHSVRISNLYGPTECTMTSTVHCAGERLGENPPGMNRPGMVPIGVPIPHGRCMILDAELEPVPVGEVGEIHIGGLGLAHGYAGEPAATAARFIPDPRGRGERLYRTGDLGRLGDDGVLHFVGRADDQVKIRGARVEPAEVTAVLATHPAVAEAAVLADRAAGEVRLRGFVSLKRDPAGRRPLTPGGAPLAEINDYETDFFYPRVFIDRADFSSGLSLRSGDCVLDIGANIGLFTLFIAGFCPGVRVHAFEPIPGIFARLADNTRGLDSVRIHRTAVGSTSGRARFEYYPRSSCQSGRYPDRAQERTILRAILEGRVQAELGRAPSERTLDDLGRLLEERLSGEDVVCDVTTVSEFIAREQIERIDLLKIDVEKSELDVLSGIASGDWPKIRQVAVEVHAIEGALEAVISLLESAGFEVSSRQEPVFENTCVFAVHARRPGQEQGPLPLPAGNSPRRAEAEATPAGLLEYLSARLPAEAVPAEIAILAELPRGARGKIDRDQLLAKASRRPEGTPPADWVEEAIADMWDEIMGHGPYAREDDFFRAGGHSLSAMRLAARLSSVFDVALPLRELFEQRTITAIAANLRERRSQVAAVASWPFTPAHSPFLALRADGPLDESRLADAVARVLDSLALTADVITLGSGEGRPLTEDQSRGRCVIQSIGRSRHLIAFSFPARQLDLRSLGVVAGRAFEIYADGAGRRGSALPPGLTSLVPRDAAVHSSTWNLEALTAANLDLFVQDYGLHRGLAVLGAYAGFLSSLRPGKSILVALPNGNTDGSVGHGGFRCVRADSRDDASFIEYVESIRDAVAGHGSNAAESADAAFVAAFVSHSLPALTNQMPGLELQVVDQCEAFSACCLAMLRSPAGIRLTLSHSDLAGYDEGALARHFVEFTTQALASPADTLSAIAEQSGLHAGRT